MRLSPPRTWYQRQRSSASVQTRLILPLVAQVIVATSIIGYLSYQSGQRAVIRLTRALMAEVSDRIQQTLSNTLATPAQLTQINVQALQTGAVDWRNLSALEQYFQQQLEILNQTAIQSIAIATAEGEYLAIERPAIGSQAFQVSRSANASALSLYQAVQRTNTPVWQATPQPNSPATVASVQPFYDRDRQTQGVIAVSVSLADVSQFLTDLTVGETGQALILDRRGALMAAPPSLPPHASQPNLVRLMPRLIEPFGNLDTIDRRQQFRVEVDRQRYFVAVDPLEAADLDWLAVIVVPEADFMSEIYANLRRSVLLCGLMLLAAIACSKLTAHYLIHPLQRLNLAAKRIAQGEFDATVDADQAGEIGELAGSFNRMTMQLRNSFAELQSLNQALSDSEHQLAQILDRLPVGVSLHRRNGSIAYINDTGRKLLNISHVPAAAGEELATTFHLYRAGKADGAPQSYYPTEELPALKALRGEEVSIDDLELQVGDRRIPIEVHSLPVYDLQGNVIASLNTFQDISQRRQAEELIANYNRELEAQVAAQTEALRQSEERWQLAIDGANDGIWDHDLRTNQHFLSPRCLEIIGYPFDTVDTFDKWTAYIHPNDLPHLQAAFQRHLSGETPYYASEYRMRCRDGTDKWLLARGKVVRNSQGQPIRAVGSITDISKRKQAEEALRESEARKHAILAAIPDMITLIRADGTYLDSIRANTLIDLVSEDVSPIGMNITELLPVEVAERQIRAIRKALETGEIQIYEQQLEIRGKAQYEELRVVPCGEDAALFMIRDISLTKHNEIERKRAEDALRESEERFRSAFDDAAIGMAIVSLDGKWLRVNSAFCDIVGYAETDLLGFTAERLTHPEDIGLVVPYTQQLLREEIRSFQLEERYLHQQGHEVWISLNVSLVRSRSGNPLYFVAQIQDISSRHTIDRIKNEFISIVSHELRTPLTAIRGSLGLLATGIYDSKPDRAKRMIEIALTDSDRLVRLVNDILDLERLESGSVKLMMEVCEVKDLMRRAVEGIRSIADAAGVHLVVNRSGAQVWAAPDAILQTLTNLLSNAIKFSDSGSTVWLSAVEMDVPPHTPELTLSPPSPEPARSPALLSSATASVWFEIRDEGRGIPSDKLRTIFERFQQVDVSDSRQKGGTGLGLTICQSIVRQHGGCIWVESTVGEGSTFYFTLPAPALANRGGAVESAPRQPLG